MRIIGLFFAAGLVVISSNANAQEAKVRLDPRSTLTLGGASGPVAELDSGGLGYSDVVNEAQNAQYFVKKHIGNVKYGDAKFAIGADAPAPLVTWISETLGNTFNRNNGSFTFLGSRRDFFNALVEEVTFPALDSLTNSAGRDFVRVTLAPEYVRKGTGNADAPQAGPAPLATNTVRLTLSGLDTSKVVRVDPLTAKVTVQVQGTGELRDYQNEAGKLEFGNLIFYVRPADAASFVNWHDDFVLKGNASEANEKSGAIEYMSTTGAVAYRVGLYNVGVTKIDEVMIGTTPVVRVECYLERFDMAAPGKAAATPFGTRKLGTRGVVPNKPASGKLIR